jgi:DNA-directed RNA polymerase specialized sigma subunit
MQVDGRFVEQARRDLTALLAAHPELEEDDVLHADMIEGNTKAFELLDELIRVERSAKILSEATEAEIERLKIRQGRFESRRAILRKYMMQLMEAANLKKAERPAATVSIAAGRPKVVITDESAIPPVYHRVKTEIDKESIGRTLKALGEVPGATLSNPEPQLRIS